MLRPGKEFYQRPSLRAAFGVLLVATFTVPTTLVLSARGGTREATTVAEKSVVSLADKKEPQGPDKVAAGAAATARLGDLVRTFQDPNVNGRSWFGYSIAVVGDNVLVGAAMNRAAYLFDGSTGKLLRSFIAPATAKGRFFGWYVAAVGKNVLIADPADETDGKTPDGRTTGRAYLFDGLTGELLRTFGNPEPENYIAFGQAVAGMGDNRVIIGATCKDVKADGAGAAFLFDASTGKMLQVLQKPKRATNANPMYACVTAIGENVLVGAPDDDAGAPQAGCVYMFDGSAGKLTSTFSNPAPTAAEFFGNWVAAAGNHVLIAAGGATIGGKRTGAAYLFDRGTGRLLRSFLNPAPGEVGSNERGAAFARCVALVGNNVLIGATLDDTGAENAGAAYLFDGTTGKLLYKFVNPNPAVDARFGVQVAALGNNVLIAAYGYGEKSPGAVYLFKGVN